MSTCISFSRRRSRKLPTALALAAVAVAVALALVVPARGDPAEPIVSLGPISVNNGVATVSGTVAADSTAAEITVNGQPVGVDASGSFKATVGLGGASDLVVSAKDPATGERFTISVPLSLAGPGGTVDDALAQLRQAGISITLPPDGFRVLDGTPLTVEGRVLDPSKLASLAVNGRELLGVLGPNGSFSQPVPGESKGVAVSATDTRGVSQTSTFPITHVSSVIRTAAGPSVSAAGARGLRIASVRYLTKGITKTKRLGMLVTVRDRRGLLVRDAIVSIRGAPKARPTISGQQVRLSNPLGQAKFALRLRPKVFSKRLFIAAAARTPTARASRVTSVRLPKLPAKSHGGRA